MLNGNDNRLLAAVLTAPKAQRRVSIQYGISPAALRVLLAVSALTPDYRSSIAATEIAAAKLAAPTRLRAQVRALVLAGLLTRRRCYGRSHLSLTAKGLAAVAAYGVAARRAAGAFLDS